MYPGWRVAGACALSRSNGGTFFGMFRGWRVAGACVRKFPFEKWSLVRKASILTNVSWEARGWRLCPFPVRTGEPFSESFRLVVRIQVYLS